MTTKRILMTKKVLFLDRDGIINVDHGYVHKIEDFDFTDGIFDVCHHAIELGYSIIIITNQAGIARGYYSIAQFELLTSWMKEQFNAQGIKITDVYYCPHHPEQGVNHYVQACTCRKPQPGMILTAQTKYNISLKDSIFIGDKFSDIQAAEAAGVKTKILLDSEYLNDNDVIENTSTIFAHKISQITGAIEYIN